MWPCVEPDYDYLKNSNELEWNEYLDRLKGLGFLPRLVVLDCGLVSQLNETDQDHLKACSKAMLNFDGKAIAQRMVSGSKYPAKVYDVDGFTESIQQQLNIIKIDKHGQLPLSRLFALDLVNNIVGLIQKHRITLEGDFLSLFLSCLLVEGIGKTLNADMDMIQVLSEYM